MGDRSWLGFGVRARPAENKDDGDDRTTAVRNGDSNNRRSLQRSNTAVPLQRNPHKAPRLPRLSSLMGLNMVAKAHTPPATSFEIAPNYPEIIHQRSESMRTRPVSYHEAAHDPPTGIWRKNADAVSDFRYRESDATWHNPSLHQMIETVLCTIMTNGISAPIPSHLNHFVASMIEEFSFQTREMQALQTKVAKLEETRANQAQEYRKTTDEWQDRERNLRLEIKRLECIISDTQEGAESVILARAGSVCNRNDRQAFRAKLDRLSRSDDDETTRSVAPGDVSAATGLRSTMPSADEANTIEDSGNVASPRVALKDSGRSEISQQMVEIPLGPEPAKYKTSHPRSIVARGANPSTPSNRNSNSTTASSASGMASSASSGITMGLFLSKRRGKAQPSHITPATSPPREPLDKGKAKAGSDPVGALRALMAANGGLPEDAIDDDENDAPSMVPPQHVRKYSFDAGDDTAKVGKDTGTGPSKPEGAVQNVSLPPTTGPQVPDTLLTSPKVGKDTGTGPSKPESAVQNGTLPPTTGPQVLDTLLATASGNDRRSSTGPGAPRQRSASSSAVRSPTLRFMGHNHVGRAHSMTADGRGVFTPGYSTPRRQAESGSEPFPSQETIQRARQLRTVTNTYNSGGVPFSDEELAALSHRFQARQQARQRALSRRRPDAVVHFDLAEEAQALEAGGAQAFENLIARAPEGQGMRVLGFLRARALRHQRSWAPEDQGAQAAENEEGRGDQPAQQD